MMRMSRRHALRAAGISGFGLATSWGVAAGDGTAAAAAPSSARDSARTAIPADFSLEVVNLAAVGNRRRAGDSFVVTGSIAGRAAGEFFAQATVVTRRDLLTESTGSLQTHTFVLPEGTIVGTGALRHDGTGTFAVVGGTGRFHAATGSYAVHQDVDGFAATAHYSFTLVDGKAASDGR